MKKIITFITSILFTINLSAQITPGQNHSDLHKIKNDIVMMSGSEDLSHLIINPNPSTYPILNSNSKSTMTSEIIGWTTYDLQTNGSIQNRIVVHEDGTISAGWTMSSELNSTWDDRGTGYNYFDGSSWGPVTGPPGPFPARLEDSRVGWPSIIALDNGKECAITHSTQNSYINVASRASIGTGTWANINVSEDYLIWNRSASGGADGNTIHMVALTEPMGTGWSGSLYNGLNGALLYFRSQDGGTTWDIQNMQLPEMDTAYFLGFSADDYAIAAQGETVVVAYFNAWGDSFILKSTDNGDNWTKTIFLDFPVDKYAVDEGIDLDADGILDQIYSTDNTGTLILDNNGDAHVFYGIMMYADDDLADGNWSYFPLTNGIAYWNESFGADNTPAAVHAGDTSLWYSDMMNDHWIAVAPDLNGDPNILGIDEVGGYALYGRGLASMSSAGVASNGDVYLSFSGYTETIDNGSQVFRHIYVTKSEDGGMTWKDPVDVTPYDGPNDFNGMHECVFGSMSPVVDDKIRMIYQMDYEPGITLQGDMDMVDYNAIVYLEIDTAGLFDGPTAIIEENDIDNINDNKIFDILGREWKSDFADLPKGVYIIDRKKIFKTK
ncbi:MAG: hypothetical protein VX762_05745 [Bacteroidota bacterium]|nr:hypothetical protein [Bacteroidota bacterium]